jgi:probable rRNA maturation factor
MHEIFINPREYDIDVHALKRLIDGILTCEGASSKLRVEITFIDDSYIRKLNSQYLGRDYPTDCLCFILSDEARNKEIADIYISYDRAVEQAMERKETLGFELAILAAHGVLHALGYKDDKPIKEKQEEYVYKLFTTRTL